MIAYNEKATNIFFIGQKHDMTKENISNYHIYNFFLAFANNPLV